MQNFAIRAEGLSKRYQIGSRQSYGSLRETLRHTAMAPVRRMRSAFGRGEAERDSRGEIGRASCRERV